MSKLYKNPVSVLVVVYSADGQFLLMEREQQPGYWQSVTGSLEPGEVPAQAALRELAEETGLQIQRCEPVRASQESFPENVLIDHACSTEYEILPLWRDRYPPGVTVNTEHWFSCKLSTPQRVTLSPREHRAQAWLAPENAISRCFSPSNQALIDHINCREFVIKLA